MEATRWPAGRATVSTVTPLAVLLCAAVALDGRASMASALGGRSRPMVMPRASRAGAIAGGCRVTGGEAESAESAATAARPGGEAERTAEGGGEDARGATPDSTGGTGVLSAAMVAAEAAASAASFRTELCDGGRGIADAATGDTGTAAAAATEVAAADVTAAVCASLASAACVRVSSSCSFSLNLSLGSGGGMSGAVDCTVLCASAGSGDTLRITGFRSARGGDITGRS